MAWATSHNHGAAPEVHTHTVYSEILFEIRIGNAGFMLNAHEVVQLRDDLSRAITEAATAAAKAVQAEGAAA